MELAFDIQNRGQRQVVVQPEDTAGGWTVGRAFDATVILTDPHVDPQQLRISRCDDGTLEVEDRSSTNGTRLDGERLEGPTKLKSGARLDLGHTRLRVYLRDHAVSPTLHQTLSDLREQLSAPLAVLLATLLGIGSQLAFHYLGFAGEYEFQHTARETFGFLVQVVAWTLFWAVITRVLRGEFHLRAHWTIGALLIGLSPLLDELVALIAFNLQSLGAYRFLDALATSAALIVALFATLTVATHWTTVRRWFGAVAPTLLLLFSVYGLPMLGKEESVSAPQLLGLSRPPALALRGGVDSSDFQARQQELFDAVNELAAED